MFRWEDSLVSRVDGVPDGRPIHVKSVYKCGFKNIWICVDGAFTIVSIYKYDQNHYIFSFLSYSEALFAWESQTLKDSKKGRLHDGVILL